MHTTFAAFSAPPFRFYFLASCSATLGVWIVRFLLGWTVWTLTESAFWVGIASAFLLAPTLVLSPLFGVLSDRIDPRTGVLCTAAANSVVCSAMAIAFISGAVSLPWTLTMALAYGCITSAHHPMRLALIPKILSDDLLPSGIGLSAIVFNVARILGPALAAWLIYLAGTGVAFAVSAGLFLTTLVLLFNVPPIKVMPRDRSITVLTDLKAGLGFIRQAPLIRLVLVMTLINGLLGRTVMELLPAISGQLADGTAQSLAILTAAAGVGSIAGGLLISRQHGDPAVISRLIFGALLLGALILLPVVVLTGLTWLVPVMTLASLCMTITGTGCQALLQLMVADAYRGRVMSIWTVISMGSPALGAFAMGYLADALGFGWTFGVFVAGALVATLVLMPQQRRFGEREAAP
ncbi:MFS transporter [Marinimicrobium alkaliphilum]|uniref:MFS transporter n=1 Tax=Marinimicrobium alkaliphilum TaxID=2202654 RepID=UPI000DB9833C|nr:MFS transporter [Marinimicrobium alkaliphilum]